MPNLTPGNFLDAPNFVFSLAIGLRIDKESNNYKVVDPVCGTLVFEKAFNIGTIMYEILLGIEHFCSKIMCVIKIAHRAHTHESRF